MSKKREGEVLTREECEKLLAMYRNISAKSRQIMDADSSKGQVVISAIEMYRDTELEIMRLERVAEIEDKTQRMIDSLQKENEHLRHRLEEMISMYGDPTLQGGPSNAND